MRAVQIEAVLSLFAHAKLVGLPLDRSLYYLAMDCSAKCGRPAETQQLLEVRGFLYGALWNVGGVWVGGAGQVGNQREKAAAGGARLLCVLGWEQWWWWCMGVGVELLMCVCGGGGDM